jgi:transcriptional regulator with XRE-family HTH domain
MLIELPTAFDALGIYANRAALTASYNPPVADKLKVFGYGAAGTGGIECTYTYRDRPGYAPFVVILIVEPESATADPSFADAMRIIQSGFGRTLSSLTEIFGVSRQTLYNWLNGEIPKEQHHDKLVQLAASARVFSENSFKVTSNILSRTVSEGKSFLQLVGAGADGAKTAEKLIKIVQRGNKSQAVLAEILGDRKAEKPIISDIGAPFFNEDV